MAETNTKANKANFFGGIAKFFREFKSEVKKVVWPTPKATFKNTGIVLLAIILIGLFVYLLDWGLYSLLHLVMNMSKPS